MVPNISSLEQGAWYAGIILCLLVIVRAVRHGIARRYWALVLFLAVSVLRSILLASVPFNTNLYAEAYLYTLPLLYGSYICLVLEIYDHAFEHLRGIALLGRWFIVGTLVAGAVFAAATTLMTHDSAREQFPLLGLVFRLELISLKTLVVFLLLVCGVLIWFPIPQRRNVLLIGFGSTALFITLAAPLVVRGLNPTAWTRIASTSALYAHAICMAVWALTLQPLARDVARLRPISTSAEREALITAQLNSVNRALESLRKVG